jgi:hypothetical protein
LCPVPTFFVFLYAAIILIFLFIFLAITFLTLFVSFVLHFVKYCPVCSSYFVSVFGVILGSYLRSR